jgi:hypothetical protein
MSSTSGAWNEGRTGPGVRGRGAELAALGVLDATVCGLLSDMAGRDKSWLMTDWDGLFKEAP